MTEDLYETLGVDKDASPEEIKAAYRRRAKDCHPDKNGGDPDKAEEFKQVALAHRVLSDEEERAHYDRTGGTRSKANDPETQARNEIITTFMTVVTALKPEDVAHSNLVELTAKGLEAHRQDGRNCVRECDKSLKKLNAVKKRLQKKEAADPFLEAVIEGSIAAAERATAQAVDGIAILDKALDLLLNSYEYDFEADINLGWTSSTETLSDFLRNGAWKE